MTVRAIDLVMGGAWAITPDALDTILAIANRANDDPQAVAAKLGRPLENTRAVRERDGTAIIPITGPIFRRANLFTEVSGATSVEILATDIQSAADNPRINRIVLEIDSPGGEAAGIGELAGMIRGIGKPVTAYVDGTAASAAYWLAAASDRIVASPTALLGSIGVVATYRPEKDGPIKIISNVSPLKQATPDTAEGRVEAQRIVDELAAVFVRDVATYRNRSIDTVLSDFGRGGILVGAAAVTSGLADSLGTFESLFQSAGVSGPTPRSYAMSDQSLPAVTRETIAADHPALLAAIEADAHTTGYEAGQLAERTRVGTILEAVAAAQHARALADAAIAQGLTAEQATAMIAAVPPPIIVEATQPDGRDEFRRAMLAEGAQQAPTADSATGDPETPSDPEQAAKSQWDSDAALRAEFSGDFDRWQAFTKAKAAGRVKILRK